MAMKVRCRLIIIAEDTACLADSFIINFRMIFYPYFLDNSV